VGRFCGTRGNDGTERSGVQYMTKSSGPRTELSGTPQKDVYQENRSVSHLIQKQPYYRILWTGSCAWTSDSEAGVKTEKSGVAGRDGECGDDVVGLLVKERRGFDILPVKKRSKAVCK